MCPTHLQLFAETRENTTNLKFAPYPRRVTNRLRGRGSRHQSTTATWLSTNHDYEFIISHEKLKQNFHLPVSFSRCKLIYPSETERNRIKIWSASPPRVQLSSDLMSPFRPHQICTQRLVSIWPPSSASTKSQQMVHCPSTTQNTRTTELRIAKNLYGMFQLAFTVETRNTCTIYPRIFRWVFCVHPGCEKVHVRTRRFHKLGTWRRRRTGFGPGLTSSGRFG